MGKTETGMRQLAWETVEREADKAEARAVGVIYNPATRTLTLILSNGCRFTFPVSLRADLRDATPEQLAAYKLDANGEHIWWEEPDAGFSVPGFLIELVGGQALWKAWSTGWQSKLEEMERTLRSEMGRQGGSVRSEAKAKAVRENGKKGGRPRKAKQAS